VKLMLGWTWVHACLHAQENGWRVNSSQRHFVKPDGERVVYCRGSGLADILILLGREFNEIIHGPMPVDWEIACIASSRLRLRGEVA
jgi:hypothetical protein